MSEAKAESGTAVSTARPPTARQPGQETASEEISRYRSVSRQAIIASVLGVFGLLAFSHPVMAVFPIISIVLAVAARRSIRRYPNELVGLWPATIAGIASAAILVSSLTMHVVIYATEVPEGYQRISFVDLQPDARGPATMVSERAIELDGQMVFLKGYVYPNDRQNNLTSFVLVRDKGTCCFGGQPKLTDIVYVRLENGLTINYSWRLRKLAGIFSIDRTNRQVGKVNVGLYRLNADYLR